MGTLPICWQKGPHLVGERASDHTPIPHPRRIFYFRSSTCVPEPALRRAAASRVPSGALP